MSRYQSTILYWNQVFSGIPLNDPMQPIPIAELEKALEWLVTDADSILDFGCGSGRILLRTLALGAHEVWGVDISSASIQRLQDLAIQYHVQERSHFRCGSVEILGELEDGRFDTAILSNVIDNLRPDDAQRVLEETHRVVKVDGKVLCKLNPYLPTDEVECDPYFCKVGENFYQEESGLYLWNLSQEEVERRLQPYFQIEMFQEVDCGNVKNRLYYMRNRK